MKNKSIKWGKNVKLAAYMNSIFILAKRKKQDLGWNLEWDLGWNLELGNGIT